MRIHYTDICSLQTGETILFENISLLICHILHVLFIIICKLKKCTVFYSSPAISFSIHRCFLFL